MNYTRRQALKTAGCALMGGSFMSFTNYDKKQSKHLPQLKCDVLIIGGGTAGVIAAIQSARLGVSTVLIENGSLLGGTITAGGVAFPGLFHAWGRQIIGGIGWELVSETVKLGCGSLPDFSVHYGKSHPKHQIFLNKHLYALLAEEKCLKAGVTLRYYESPVAVHRDGNCWHVEIAGKGTSIIVVCKQLVDCTGNAFVAKLAGYELLREAETQPGSLIFQLGGVGVDSIDVPHLTRRLKKAIANGEVLRSDVYGGIHSLLTSHVTSAQHVLKADSTTSTSHTDTNIRGRESLLRVLRFFHSLPECEKVELLNMQPETAVRETYRIDGLYRITVDDYMEGRLFDDSVCYSFYPIDLHDEHGVTPRQLIAPSVPSVPLRALIPQNSSHFIVAGRSVSSDREANSALRVQASCMGMGQAAGAAAALAAQSDTTPANLSIVKLKETIARHGGIVPA